MHGPKISLRSCVIFCFTSALLFLNLDGYHVSLFYSSPFKQMLLPGIFGEPSTSSPQAEMTKAIAMRCKPFLGEELTQMQCIGWDHGWPFAFLARNSVIAGTEDRQKGAGYWDTYSRWPIDNAKVFWFLPTRLSFNICFFLVVVIACWFGLKNAPDVKFRYGLKTLLSLTLLIAVSVHFQIFRSRFSIELIAMLVVVAGTLVALISLLKFAIKFLLYSRRIKFPTNRNPSAAK